MTRSNSDCVLNRARQLLNFVLLATVGIVLFLGKLSFGQPARSVLLSSLDVSKTAQSTGRARVDNSYTGKPLSIGGRKFDHGLGTHALSELAVELNGGADRFTAQVSLDDNAATNATCNGSVVFGVFGDNRLLWKSGVMRWRQPAAAVDVNLKGIKTLLLVVSDARDGINCDHADWCDARFEVSGAAPQTVVASPQKQQQAMILTPPPPTTPHINGAKAFGVRPGHPFLFTIPATGRRPMEFAVDALAAGLKVDPHTGQITGAVRDRGEYRVTFRDKNALGLAQRPFTIVCGDAIPVFRGAPARAWDRFWGIAGVRLMIGTSGSSSRSAAGRRLACNANGRIPPLCRSYCSGIRLDFPGPPIQTHGSGVRLSPA